MNKNKKILLTTIIILTILLLYIDNFNSQKLKTHGLIEETGDIDAYFCPEENCSNVILSRINNSKKIVCAFFDLTDEKIIELLKEKKADIVIDENNYKNYGYKISGSGLMHNKFCVLDDKTIITGSYNPTKNNKNNNNLILLDSETLAKNYKKEFYEIKNLRKKNEKTQTTQIIFNNKTLKQYFCPEDNCQQKIIEELEKAQKSIYFMTFTFTDKKISHELIKKENTGISIQGITESFQNKKYWTYPELITANISILLDEKPTIQHNKIFIIDNTTIITGSYNPTKSANTINDENILIIKEPKIVKKYTEYFIKIYSTNK